MIKTPKKNAEVSSDFLVDDERLIETRDPSFWNPCADSEWAYVGVPLSSCEAVDGPREVKKIDCTGLLTESVQAMFQEIVKAFVEDEGFEPVTVKGVIIQRVGLRKKIMVRKKFNERATETINNLVCLGSGERPSFLMLERMRWLAILGTWWPSMDFGGLEGKADELENELEKCLEESNRPHDKELLYILLGKRIVGLKAFLGDCAEHPPSRTSVVNNKLQCATRQRALLSCFHAFDAGVEDWCFGVKFCGVVLTNAGLFRILCKNVYTLPSYL